MGLLPIVVSVPFQICFNLEQKYPKVTPFQLTNTEMFQKSMMLDL